MKIMLVNCGLRSEFKSNLSNNEHYLITSENRAWKSIQALAIRVQQHCKGHGCKSRIGLNFCQSLFSLLFKWCSFLQKLLSYSFINPQFT